MKNEIKIGTIVKTPSIKFKITGINKKEKHNQGAGYKSNKVIIPFEEMDRHIDSGHWQIENK